MQKQQNQQNQQNQISSVAIYNDILTLVFPETGIEKKASAMDRIRKYIDSLEKENHRLYEELLDMKILEKENNDLKEERDFLESRINILELQLKNQQQIQNKHIIQVQQQESTNDSIKHFFDIVQKIQDEKKNQNTVIPTPVPIPIPKPNITTQLSINTEPKTMAQRIAPQNPSPPNSCETEEIGYAVSEENSYIDNDNDESVYSIDVLKEYRFMNEILKKENTELFMTLINVFKYAGSNKKAQIPQSYKNDWTSLHELTGYLFFRGNDGKPWFVFQGANYPVLTEFGKKRFNEFLNPKDEKDIKALDTIEAILFDNKFIKNIKQQLSKQTVAKK